MKLQEGSRYIRADETISGIVTITENTENFPNHIYMTESYETYNAEGRFLATYESDKDLICRVDESWYQMFLLIQMRIQTDSDWTREFGQFLYERCPAEAEGLRIELNYWATPKEDR